MAMAGGAVTALGRRGAKIPQYENADGSRAGRVAALRFYEGADIIERPALAAADFLQRLPHGRFETQAGALAVQLDITVSQRGHVT
jgi:hypothetical protein